jgi:F-type H+-transporting ATPase subunit a
VFAAINFPPIGEVLNWRSIAFGNGAFALNKVGLITLFAALATLVMFGVAGRQGRLVPRGVQNLVEAAVDFITNSIVRESMGPQGEAWVPWLTGLFFFILISNLFEVIPFIQMPATARIGVTAPLALMVYVVFIGVGIRSKGLGGYLKSSLIPSGVPIAILPLLIPLELLSTFIVRPFALAIRLFGNLLAGHLLLIAFAVLTEALFVKSILLVADPLPFAMLVVLTAYEIFVSFLQAFIFTTLAAVYIGEAMAESH